MFGGGNPGFSVPFFQEIALLTIASLTLLGYFGLRLRARWLVSIISWSVSLVLAAALLGVGGPVSLHGPAIFATGSLQALEAFLGFFFLCTLSVGLVLVRVCPLSVVLTAFILLSLWVSVLASDWFFLWVWLEIGAVLSYGLVALGRTSSSVEAAVRYFSVGLVSSGILAFGVVLLGLVFGDAALYRPTWVGGELAWFSGFLLCPFLIKLGAAPFHFWVPDTYEGASLFTTLFLSVVVKLGLFFVLVKVLCAGYLVVDPASGALGGVSLRVSPRLLLAASALSSMLVGGFGALFQNRLKRLLAYSSIGNLGFALCGLTSIGVGGLVSSIAYMGVYSFSVLLLFLTVLKYRTGAGLGKGRARLRYSVVFVTDVARLLEPSPHGGRVRPFIFTLTLFSLAGVPPLSGFWAKYFILDSLALKGDWLGFVLLGCALGYSVLSSFYYLNLIRVVSYASTRSTVSPVERFNRPQLANDSALSLGRGQALAPVVRMVCWSSVLYGWVVLPQQLYRVVGSLFNQELLLLNPLFHASVPTICLI